MSTENHHPYITMKSRLVARSPAAGLGILGKYPTELNADMINVASSLICTLQSQPRAQGATPKACATCGAHHPQWATEVHPNKAGSGVHPQPPRQRRQPARRCQHGACERRVRAPAVLAHAQGAQHCSRAPRPRRPAGESAQRGLPAAQVGVGGALGLPADT